jgi:hypothetical protein
MFCYKGLTCGLSTASPIYWLRWKGDVLFFNVRSTSHHSTRGSQWRRCVVCIQEQWKLLPLVIFAAKFLGCYRQCVKVVLLQASLLGTWTIASESIGLVCLAYIHKTGYKQLKFNRVRNMDGYETFAFMYQLGPRELWIYSNNSSVPWDQSIFSYKIVNSLEYFSMKRLFYEKVFQTDLCILTKSCNNSLLFQVWLQGRKWIPFNLWGQFDTLGLVLLQ